MAITDNIQNKIKQARAAGYTDDQIKTFLGTQGVDTSVVAKVAPDSPKVAAARTAAVAAEAQAKQANSPIEIAKQTIAGTAKTAAKDIISTGESLGESAAAGDVTKNVTEGDTGLKDTAIKVLRQIATDKKAGKDTSRLEAAYNSIAGHTQENDIGNILPSLGKSNLDAVLEAVGVGADLLSGGGIAPAADVAAQAAARGGEAVAKTAATAARATKSAGETVYKSAITPTVSEAERIQGYQAKVPFLTRVGNALSGTTSDLKPVTRADTALQKGLVGREKDIGVQATREADNLYTKTIAPAVKASKELVTKADLFAPIEKRIAATIEPGRKQGLQEAFDAIQDEYKNHSQWTLEEGQQLKRELDQFTPEKVFRGKSVVNDYRTLQNDMANAIRQKTYGALKDQNIRKAYLDYGNLSELRKIGVKALTNATGKGGFGSFWSGAYDAATTPVKTVGGQVLYRVGNKLEFLADKGVKTFGQFLKSKGYDRP